MASTGLPFFIPNILASLTHITPSHAKNGQAINRRNHIHTLEGIIFIFMAQIADLSIIFSVLKEKVPLWNNISDMIMGSSYTQTLA